MTASALRAAYAARNRIRFNLCSKSSENNNIVKENVKSEEQDKNRPVCFWTDEEYVSER